ncbi:hypothetical protein BLX24_23370 [Arsenicibacter rosenii]|uniref:DUF4932 domain-containing protein n=2 Tax=Arsenicibacter rosenii TaxID=1750698 RepID=A0A1S2VDC7_9BACT|nr:hypothetical protein BLX24_23370 [Arsenicibacter rosenii]
MLFWSGSGAMGQGLSGTDSPVRLSEAYELANIILALTDYGKTDPWEVSQQSAYYREVRTHFDAFTNHPLLASVNYSRKEWEKYLSFRTDAYAFAFDSTGRLVRQFPLMTNKGVNPFEEHVAQVEAFARVSGFRQFYRAHLPYYQNLATAYLASQHYPEMRQFLETELGKQTAAGTYAIVMSPLVGRMNCHRTNGGVGTDFITLPGFLLSGKAVQEATPAEIASGTHMLFTELDHAFVNPLTEQYRSLVQTGFDNRLWDAGSGYERDSLATFNEYMTWAVYDLFVARYFPSVPSTVCTDWTLQNETRGFWASALFTQKLTSLYRQRKAGQTLRDIYPVFIKQLGKLQQTLRKPAIKACNLADQTVSDTTATVMITFSEPMHRLSAPDVVRVAEHQGTTTQERIMLTRKANELTWLQNGRAVRFRIQLAGGAVNHLLFNYPWKTSVPLRSRQGIDLPPYSRVKITVRSTLQAHR